jgi:gamma-glutamyltranspeptidase/glutathione hydrolase
MWLVRWIKPLSFALLAPLAVGFRLDAQIDRITGKNFATRSEVLARHGIVCTSVPAATEVGIDILKRGGSAVDAAIAANATLGLMEPVSNGIGGDLFAIVYSARENKLYGINGSGRSPAGLRYDQMKTELEKLQKPPSPQSSPWQGRGGREAPGEGRSLTIPPVGMLPISVPGTVDAWADLHKRFGKLKLSDDLAPAIRYADEGFPVTELIAYYWAFGPRLYKGLPGAFPETYTLDGKGRTPAKGDIFKNPDLAKTLRLIGEKGRDVFYRRNRRHDRQFHAGQWRLPSESRFREAYIDLGRPGLDELSWLRRLRASTKWSGHRGTADIKHPRRIRSPRDGTQFTRDAAHNDRSEENCVG